MKTTRWIAISALVLASYPATSQTPNPNTPETPGRWCTAGVTTDPEETPHCLKVHCDGYEEWGFISKGALLKTVSVKILAHKNEKERWVVFSPGLKAEDLALGILKKSDAFRKAIDKALAAQSLPALQEGDWAINALEIDKDERLSEDPFGRNDLALRAAFTDLQLSKIRVMAKELMCLDRIERIPMIMPNDLFFQRARKSNENPVAVLQSAIRKGIKGDYIMVPDGIYFYAYTSSPNGNRHVVKIPGNTEKPETVWYYHEVHAKSRQTPFFMSKGLEGDTELKGFELDTSKILKDKKDHGLRMFHEKILEAFRRFKNEHKVSPRFRAQTNIELVKEALESCRAIKPLQEELNGYEKHALKLLSN